MMHMPVQGLTNLVVQSLDRFNIGSALVLDPFLVDFGGREQQPCPSLVAQLLVCTCNIASPLAAPLLVRTRNISSSIASPYT